MTGVVEDAETGGVSGHGMVKPAGDAQRGPYLACRQHLGRLHRGAGRQKRSLIHARVDLVITGTEVELTGVGDALAAAQRLDRPEIVLGVESEHLTLMGLPWYSHLHPIGLESAICVQQIVGVPEPDRLHGMSLAQLMPGQSILIDESSSANQSTPPVVSSHDRSLSATYSSTQ